MVAHPLIADGKRRFNSGLLHQPPRRCEGWFSPRVGNMRSLDINRRYIGYEDNANIQKAENDVIGRLIAQGKVVNLSSEIVDNIITSDTDWNSNEIARKTIRTILEKFLGETVYFSNNGKKASAYLTRKGVDHALAGVMSPQKAAVYSSFFELVKNAEYAYSSINHEHSEGNANITGEKIWDCFIAVAKIGNEHFPIVFTVRTIDSDVRSQIYAMAMKKEAEPSRGDGRQENTVQTAYL